MDWATMTDYGRNAAIAKLAGLEHLPFFSSLDAARLVEGEIEHRGLVERYQNVLIEVLGLDMQVFNSAIELNPHFAPSVVSNTFEWRGHASLWLYLRATPAQRAEAAYRVLREGT